MSEGNSDASSVPGMGTPDHLPAEPPTPDPRRLANSDPMAAEAWARSTLEGDPGSPDALLVLGISLRCTGRLAEGRAILQALAQTYPERGDIALELGHTLRDLKEHDAAVPATVRATKLDPHSPEAWRVLSEELFALGRDAASAEASARASLLAIQNPAFRSVALTDQPLPPNVLEEFLLEYLETEPDDADAINLLGEIALASHRTPDAEVLFGQCLELRPDFPTASYNRAVALFEMGKFREALSILERLLAEEPHNAIYWNVMGEALLANQQMDRALGLHEDMTREFPKQPLAHLGRCLCLAALGREAECVAAYRRILKEFPSCASAYWGLAGLRDARFSDAEIAALQDQLSRPALSDSDRVLFLFAQGRAFEQRGAFEQAFRSYNEGNALHRSAIRYKPDRTTQHVVRSKKLFTRDFFARRAGWGIASRAPIFIVGLPRSGSSLIEQILSNHSAVEALGELPHVTEIARNLHFEYPGSDLPEVVGALDAGRCKVLGEQYLAETRERRKQQRPHFTDKAPRNFTDIGLIQLILPNAKIVDVRRHPLSCCISNYTQRFVAGQNFTYSLDDLARYYCDYIALMSHFDTVLPGKVHRVFYERMIDDLEIEVRRLLEYLELPFEEGCLRFHERRRYVRTASADQVHSPIFADSVDRWRNFETHLESARAILGPVLTAYPSVPDTLHM